MRLDDEAISRLRAAVREPDLSGTRYRLRGVAGAGGMGTVYAVEDTELGRQVALKVLDVPDPGIEERLRREAQVLARLEHPGIVPVHDVGTLPDGRAFYTMKLVQGVPLDAYAARRPPLPERLRVFLRIADSVAFAHAQGVLHRDLKPQNVMVGAFGEVLVMDWGLAKVEGDRRTGIVPPARQGTGEGAVLGRQASCRRSRGRAGAPRWMPAPTCIRSAPCSRRCSGPRRRRRCGRSAGWRWRSDRRIVTRTCPRWQAT
jgi:serine/threonine protein kinase